MLSKNLICKINRIIENFIWNGRKPKLKLSVLQGDHIDGGMGLFDLGKRDAALKIAWISRYNELPENMKLLANYHIKPRIANSEFW